MLEGRVPELSTAGFEGGVSKLPTLTLAGDGCEAIALIPAGWVAEEETYLCEGGGGSSKLGRLEAAGRLAVSGGCEA